MKKAIFKKLIQEALSDSPLANWGVRAQDICNSTLNSESPACKLLGDMQKFIDLGLGKVQTFSPDEVILLNNVITAAKEKFGADNEDVKNFEAAIQGLLNIKNAKTTGSAESTMESLKEDFAKYKLY